MPDQKTTDQKLTDELKQFLDRTSDGLCLVGIASVDRFEGAPSGHHPRDFIGDARAVVVIAMPIASGLMNWPNYMEDSRLIKESESYVDKQGNEITWSPRTSIRKHVERRCCYEIINNELQSLSMRGAIFLENAGHVSTYLPTTYGQTLSWPGNYQWDYPLPPGGYSPFSHKHAAVAAGLGDFGLNNLFLTEKYGPRQRLVSIITAAPLTADPLMQKSVCLGKKCSLCKKQCPSQALGAPEIFEIAGRKITRYKHDIDACRNYYKASFLGNQCGRECMTACPVGSLTRNI